jgi:hypothetical protein
MCVCQCQCHCVCVCGCSGVLCAYVCANVLLVSVQYVYHCVFGCVLSILHVSALCILLCAQAFATKQFRAKRSVRLSHMSLGRNYYNFSHSTVIMSKRENKMFQFLAPQIFLMYTLNLSRIKRTGNQECENKVLSRETTESESRADDRIGPPETELIPPLLSS